MTPARRNENTEGRTFDYLGFVAKYAGAAIESRSTGELIYAQGDPADAAYYIASGAVKNTVTSAQGKEAVLALLKPGEFFGEECLHPDRCRASTVVTVATKTACEIVRLDRRSLVCALGEDADFGFICLDYVLRQNDKLRIALTDQLYHSSEQRLARILLTLASTDADERWGEIALPLTQETLAGMVGTTRPRINRFMTKFRKLGYVAYGDKIRVSTLLKKLCTNEDPQRIEY
jgi:CRP/FNR family transcriptional regulator, cyclic AMP receptor protein